MSNKSLLDELRARPQEGELRLRDVRYLLIRPETLIAFQKSLEEEVGPERAGEVLFPGGFTGGRLSGQKFKSDLGLSEQEAAEFMCRMGGEIGWGRFELRQFDLQAGRMVVEVTNSAFAAAYGGGAQAGVCHLIRGVLGGLGAGLFGRSVHATESECLACGQARCRFEIEVDA